MVLGENLLGDGADDLVSWLTPCRRRLRSNYGVSKRETCQSQLHDRPPFVMASVGMTETAMNAPIMSQVNLQSLSESILDV